MSATVEPLIADLHAVRCGGCKVVVEDPLSTTCTMCGATFDRVVSNHVGLANRLNTERSAVLGDAPAAAETEELVAVPRSVLAAVASALGDVEGASACAAAVTVLAEQAPAISADEASQAAGEAAAQAREAGSLG